MKKRILTVLLVTLCLLSPVLAQTTSQVTDEGDEVMAPVLPAQDGQTGRTEKHTLWSDPLYYQFDKMLPDLAVSIGRLDSRISTLAVTALSFSPNLDESFRKVASAKLYGQLLMENPRLKLIKCDECNMLRSEIKAGTLTVSRGLADQESRRKLAEKLAVQGFMSAMVIEEKRQLTIVLNVYDAQEGRVILSDAITGVPVPENTYYNIYLGQLTIPVNLIPSAGLSSATTAAHYAILIGVEKSMRFAESWFVAASFGGYADNNKNQPYYFEPIQTGLLFDGSLGWEALALMNNNLSLSLMGGVGQFLSPQFNFSVFLKAGIKATIGQVLTINIFNYSLLSDNINLAEPNADDEANNLGGSALAISFGYQF
jgi:hypothetical protein